MSALPQKADSQRLSPNVCLGPKADSCAAAKMSLFDHLVAAWEYRQAASWSPKSYSGEVQIGGFNHLLVFDDLAFNDVFAGRGGDSREDITPQNVYRRSFHQ
jgi:hypothetical protein